jgi:glycosyltransferase involved in cell wall biosynthesis
MNKYKADYPKISIVVPILNMGKYVGRTLASIVKQNYLNCEVIIQDGYSNDETIKIAKSYIRKYPKLFRLYSEIDKGQYDAIYKGFKRATGEIYTFINGDDYYEKNALLNVGKHFHRYPDTLWLVGRGRVVNEKGREYAKWVTQYKNILLSLNRYSLLLLVNYIMQPSAFFSKRAYQKYGPLTGDKFHLREYDLWCKLGRDEMPAVVNKYLSSYSLFPGTGSTIFYASTVLKDDFEAAKNYTSNPVILALRFLHNWARVAVYWLFYRK